MGLDITHSKPSIKISEAQDYFTLEELNINKDFVNRHKHVVSLIEGENDQLIEVIFMTGCGYQRKEMNEHFVKDFLNNKFYFDIDSVKKAFSYIKSKNKNDQHELELTFQKDFIDSFVEGESIFWISW